MAGLKRIILHWTAGSYTASARALDAYHFIVEGDGTVVEGDYAPEDNIRIRAPHYAAHTGRFNTGSIGVSVAAMAGAKGWPSMKPGRYPITQAQLVALAQLVAKLCRDYGIPVTRETVLTHAEVEPTLGVKQRGKWDIRWLPGMTLVGNPIEVGDVLRSMVIDELERPTTGTVPVTAADPAERADPDPALMNAIAALHATIEAAQAALLKLDEAVRPKD